MIKRLLHKPRERDRSELTDLVADEGNERGMSVLRIQRPTLNVQRSTFNAEGSTRTPNAPATPSSCEVTDDGALSVGRSPPYFAIWIFIRIAPNLANLAFTPSAPI